LGAALLLALRQIHIAWLFANASIVETRRLNRIALLTPFLSVLVQAGFLGLVYSTLFGVDIASYIPYLAVSLALWQALANFLANAALYNEAINRHLSFTLLSPYTIHLAGLIETFLLLLVKLMAAMLIVMLVAPSRALLTSAPLGALGLAALAVLIFFTGILTAFLLDRFRVLRALQPQLIFLAFLITPVIWHKQQLGRAAWIADYNPIFHALEIVRGPLLGQGMPWVSLGVTLLVAACLAAGAVGIHSANRKMIVFRWVA
jgi:ABC-type polysaccharide/polyol phosphate export permease